MKNRIVSAWAFDAQQDRLIRNTNLRQLELFFQAKRQHIPFYVVLKILGTHVFCSLRKNLAISKDSSLIKVSIVCLFSTRTRGTST